MNILLTLGTSILQVCFSGRGFIESWGRGTNKIIDSCVEAGLPEPIIEEDQGGFRVTFLKDKYTGEHLQKLDVNERQVKAVLFIKENGSINNSKYQELNGIGKTLATKELQDLVNKNIILQSGSAGRSIKYILPKK